MARSISSPNADAWREERTIRNIGNPGDCATAAYHTGAGSLAMPAYLTSPTIPTIRYHGCLRLGSLGAISCPIGSSLGKYRRASSWLITATFGRLAASESSKYLPRMSGIPSALKYCGVTIGMGEDGNAS